VISVLRSLIKESYAVDEMGVPLTPNVPAGGVYCPEPLRGIAASYCVTRQDVLGSIRPKERKIQTMPFKVEPKLYAVWKSMRRRCSDPNAKQYSDYGGRGIKVCAAWASYKAFERDMSPRPPGTTLDRIDNNGDYSPDNCRWATRKEQQRNRRYSLYVTIDGASYRAVELADQSGLKTDTIIARANAGLSLSEVMSPERRPSYVPHQLEAAWRKSVAVRTARTHCKHGHKWTPENTYITPEGWKNCRKCACLKMRRRTAAKAATDPAVDPAGP